MSHTDQRLAELGIELPSAPAPAGSYVPAIQVGNLLYLSGAICLVNGEMTHTGKVGESRDIAYAQAAARVCALNLLAVAKAHLGDLDKVAQIVQLNGFVNGVPGFADSPIVINGASDLLVDILAERGSHTRAAVAVTGLPKDSTVEIQAVFEVTQ
ncbi:RidA family protein [Coraliomargarita sp. SDUM461004]|uniref:RidA family protein n=1 Tax=Thalassobacterium sedimentorum TaxID=3041258 RepID=A0ABU1AF24_9BACT|nr:RidA family protein [Coraliomargarita sp. SDUM461004]MDQ8193333.1 RidA family protein [Coraliomargarita sp. SDUM461004]